MSHWKKLTVSDDATMNASHIEEDVTLFAKSWELVRFPGDKASKVVLHWAEEMPRLALNATNCNMLEELTGSPDPDKWVEQAYRVGLERTKKPDGTPTKGVRIKDKAQF